MAAFIQGVNDLHTWCEANGKQNLLNEWYHENNRDILGLTPNIVARGSQIKAFWKCEHGHIWTASIKNRTSSGTKCPTCVKIANGEIGFKTWCTGDNKLDLLNEWDYEKNKNELALYADKVTKGSNTKVYWKCKEGHTWMDTVQHRTMANEKWKSRNCPYCGKTIASNKVIQSINDLETWCKENDRLDLLVEWEYDKNTKEFGVTPRTVARASHIKAHWKCERGHTWESAISYRTSNHSSGCTTCKPSSTSYQEQFIYAYLKQIFAQAIHRGKAFGAYEFDISIPEKKAVIEHQGYYYHRVTRDAEYSELEKVMLCKLYNVKLIEVVENPSARSKQVLVTGTTIEYKYESNGANQIKTLTRICECILEILGEKREDCCVNMQKVIHDANLYTKQCRTEDSFGYNYPELLNEWDYEKNEGIDPYKILHATHTNVDWICNKNPEHKWKTDVSSRTNKNHPTGCPRCAGMLEVNDIRTVYPKLYEEVNISKNTGIDAAKITIGSVAYIDWRCTKCGHEFEARAIDRTYCKSGCQKCGYNWYTGKLRWEDRRNKNSIKIIQPELFKEIRQELNGDTDLAQITCGTNKPVVWRCTKCSNEWSDRPVDRTYFRKGCTKCKFNWSTGRVEHAVRLGRDSIHKNKGWQR